MTNDEMWLLREKYGGEKSEAFFADVARLKEGEPLAYLIGSIPFLHTTIHLDSHPLIPRAETEFWVHTIMPLIKKSEGIQILDLCAGSGCIGVAILAETKMTRVDFVEIDPRHHPTIEKNIRANSIDPKRTTIYEGDLFEQITKTYDFILTNPPYIDQTLRRTETSVHTYEPHIALYGGTQGLDVIARIINTAPTHLTQNGTLIMEHEPEQTDTIHTLAQEYFMCTTHHDQYRKDRYTLLTRIAL